MLKKSMNWWIILTSKWNNFKDKELWLDLELILGMPGSTLKDFYEEFKVYYRVGYNEGKDWEEMGRS